jgi:hypothetical protein
MLIARLPNGKKDNTVRLASLLEDCIDYASSDFRQSNLALGLFIYLFIVCCTLDT